MITVMSIVRREKNISQVDLSSRTNIHQSDLSLFEAGFAKLREDDMRKIADILEVEPEDLQGEYTKYLEKKIRDGLLQEQGVYDED